MTWSEIRSNVAVGGQPLHSILVQFPVVCFTLALFTDIAYWRSANLMWQNFSSWLLLAGLVFAVLAAVAWIIDFTPRPPIERIAPAWPQPVGSLVVIVLAFLNSLVHAGDGWTAVVPWGLVLSAATVVVMALAAWYGRVLVYRHEYRSSQP